VSVVAQLVPLEKLLTAAEVGEILRVSAKTVRRLPIKCIYVGRNKRYRYVDVLKYIEEKRA